MIIPVTAVTSKGNNAIVSTIAFNVVFLIRAPRAVNSWLLWLPYNYNSPKYLRGGKSTNRWIKPPLWPSADLGDALRDFLFV
jgi:hypothetical protein